MKYSDNSVDRFIDSLKIYSSEIISSTTGLFVNRVTAIKEGVMTYKFEVACTDNQTFIVRYYPATRENIVEFEPDIMKRCYERGIKVCQVLTDSRRNPKDNLSYVAYKKLIGTSLSSRYYSLTDTEQTTIVHAISQNLKNIQDIELKGYGELIDGYQASSNSWQEFIHMIIQQGIPHLESSSFLSKETFDHLVNYLLSYRPDFMNILPRLIWADISMDNIIVDSNNTLVGFIDLEACLSGDYKLAIGYLFAKEGESSFYNKFVNSFIKDENVQQDIIDFYAILRILRIIKYYSAPLPTGTKRDNLYSYFPGFKKALNRQLNL